MPRVEKLATWLVFNRSIRRQESKLTSAYTNIMTSVCPFRSLAVGHQYSSLGTQPILCGSIPGLVPKQLRFCRNYVEIMPSVAEGVKIGIQECQHQFRGRRWNCTTVNDNLAIFGPVLDKGNEGKMSLLRWKLCFLLLLLLLLLLS